MPVRQRRSSCENMNARTLLLVLTLFPMACRRDDQPSVASAAIATNPALADSTCGFVRTAAHPEAEALVREFVRRDANGEFLQSSDWFTRAVDCPGHEGAPDVPTVVRGYKLSIVYRDSAELRAEVTWDVIGKGDAMKSTTEVDLVRAIHTPFGWRVASPALDPHQMVPPPPRT